MNEGEVLTSESDSWSVNDGPNESNKGFSEVLVGELLLSIDSLDERLHT